MKITCKNNLIIFHDPSDWYRIFEQIKKDFGTKVNISWVLKRELGFTVRNHMHWAEIKNRNGETFYKKQPQICVDFFDPKTQSWFQLKYLNLSNT